MVASREPAGTGIMWDYADSAGELTIGGSEDLVCRDDGTVGYSFEIIRRAIWLRSGPPRSAGDIDAVLRNLADALRHWPDCWVPEPQPSLNEVRIPALSEDE
jgi:hypothetical protein